MRLVALFSQLTPELWERWCVLACSLAGSPSPDWLLEYHHDLVEPEAERGNAAAQELLILLDTMLDRVIEAGTASHLRGTYLEGDRQMEFGVSHWRRLQAWPAEARRWAFDLAYDRIRRRVATADSTRWDGGATEWDHGLGIWDASEIVALEGVDVEIVPAVTRLDLAPRATTPAPAESTSSDGDLPLTQEAEEEDDKSQTDDDNDSPRPFGVVAARHARIKREMRAQLPLGHNTQTDFFEAVRKALGVKLGVHGYTNHEDKTYKKLLKQVREEDTHQAKKG